MTTLIQRFDDFERDFVELHPVPMIEKLGVGARMHEAIDKVANLRQIVAVLGPKGIGKSQRLDDAMQWFDERERLRTANDARYAPKSFLIVRNLRHDSYDDALTMLLQAVDAREPVRQHGRRRPPDVLRSRLCALFEAKRIVGIALDECEVVTHHIIQLMRDLCALSADTARARLGAQPATAPVGIGVLIVGSHTAEPLLRASDEYGQRIAEVITLPPLSIADATTIMTTWLPKAAAFTGEELVRWQSVVRLKVCHDRPTTMRHLVNTTREYARRLDRAHRLRSASGWDAVPIDFDVLTAVAASLLPPDLNAPVRRGGRRA